MWKDPVEFILDRYKGKPCIYQDRIVILFEEALYDDYLYNAYDLTSMYSDFIDLGEKLLIDDNKYFIDIDFNEAIIIKNNYQIVIERLQEITFIDK